MRRLATLLIVVLVVGGTAASVGAAGGGTGNNGEPTLGDTRDSAPKPSGDYRETLADAVADIQTYWADEFPVLYGSRYTPIPKSRIIAARPGVKFRCGSDRATYSDVEGNAAYVSCPKHPTVVYDDAELFPQLDRDFGGLAVPLALAHEWGHAIQDQAGNLPSSRVILTELQADCFAGAWLERVASGDAPRVSVRSGNLDAALAAVLSLKDPVGLTEDIDSQAHGSGFDRAAALQDGFDNGAEQCAPYLDSPPPIVEIPFTSEQEAESGGNLPAEDVIPAAINLLNDFYSQVEPTYQAKSVDDIYSFDADKKTDLPSCGGTKQNVAAVDNRVFFCIDDGDFGFDEPYLQHVYDDIGDFGVVTLIANPFATYVETLQSFPGVNDNSDNAVLGADCYTGGFTAAMYNGVLLIDPSTNQPAYQLSPGDLDETIAAYADYSQARGISKDLDVTFARLRAFRDGFFNGYGTCSSYAEQGPDLDAPSG